MTNSTVAKKDIQKLQRAIVDGLEDVKAQDIQVFDTEHLSALFERVIIASGTSNRQTKALAGSVRDSVRDAGFPKPRVEGEANGEWIIVDCGAAVVHVMQPSFRQYYNLEELWGEKPVRLKFGAAKPEEKELVEPVKATKKVVELEGNLRRSNAAKKGVAEAFPSKAQVKKDMAVKSAAKKAPARKTAVKKAPAEAVSAVAERKTAPKSAVKVAAKKVAIKKVTINDPAKASAKKSSPKLAAKKAPAKKTAVRKA
ncbi:MAG: ribosome silencing factor [Rhodoferax sp.]|uniref:ribosome silencing factor n=1 Tax=Rhodoferax sp. TaxID=50421 RepID=UPI001835B327|nr:ribosome silencing factor [Rhodoferax sp.]NMM12638.1 ribosome silencing factor [Rhodoferax sp.]